MLHRDVPTSHIKTLKERSDNMAWDIKKMKEYYPHDVTGIISLETKNDNLVTAKYGTFTEFVKLAEKRQKEGRNVKTPYTGEHDGYQRKINGVWYDWIEEWVWFNGIGNEYKISFHTVRLYKGESRRYKIVKPTAANDTQFPFYAKALKRKK